MFKRPQLTLTDFQNKKLQAYEYDDNKTKEAQKDEPTKPK